jgi:hypothetical protein
MLKYQLEWWAKAAGGQVSVDKALNQLKNDIESIS